MFEVSRCASAEGLSCFIAAEQTRRCELSDTATAALYVVFNNTSKKTKQNKKKTAILFRGKKNRKHNRKQQQTNKQKQASFYDGDGDRQTFSVFQFKMDYSSSNDGNSVSKRRRTVSHPHATIGPSLAVPCCGVTSVPTPWNCE